VWAHGRQARVEDEARRTWVDDLSEIFELDPDNTFLLKVSYWLNR
jgi:hypothetical protein